MKVLAIDPGNPRTGKFQAYDGARWYTKPPPGRWDVVLAERPEAKEGIRAGRTVDSVTVPSFWAGAGLFAADAETRLWVPVLAWKGALFGPGFARQAKEVFCANIKQAHPQECEGLDPRNEKDQDKIDSLGLWYSYMKTKKGVWSKWLVGWQ